MTGFQPRFSDRFRLRHPARPNKLGRPGRPSLPTARPPARMLFREDESQCRRA